MKTVEEFIKEGMSLDQAQAAFAAQSASNVQHFNVETPVAKNNRMDWNVQDCEADTVIDIDVRITKNPDNPRPYVLMSQASRANMAILVEQLLADQQAGTVNFITSKPGEELTFDMSVKVGAKSGKYYFIG